MARSCRSFSAWARKWKAALRLTSATLLLALASCGGAPKAVVHVDGSSTVFPISEAVAEEFGATHPDIRVLVGVSGTGGGFKKFCRREIDIVNASRPIKSSELKLAREAGIDFIELAIAYDGIALVVHPENTWCDQIRVSELKKLWEPAAQQNVLTWKQLRDDWPDREIYLFGPGVDSGTFDYFTEAIVGESGASRGDYTSSEDDNVLVQGVASDRLALGFFGFAYYEENRDKLKVVGLADVGTDTFVKPTSVSVGDGTYKPLSRPLFIYIRRDAADSPAVQEFIGFYLDQAPQLAGEVGYVPLSAAGYESAKDRFRQRTTGSSASRSKPAGAMAQH